MEEKLKEIRTQIDAAFQLTGLLKPSREIALAKTHFQESKMSLGKILEYTGVVNPYPESKNAASPTIEKTADTATSIMLPHDDHTANVKAIRATADCVCNEIWDVVIPSEGQGINFAKSLLFRDQAFIECQKGMMWLGMELGRIRDEEEAAKK